jgi:hypothetical protein
MFWEELLAAVERHEKAVRIWVKAHSGILLNDYPDMLATKTVRGKDTDWNLCEMSKDDVAQEDDWDRAPGMAVLWKLVSLASLSLASVSQINFGVPTAATPMGFVSFYTDAQRHASGVLTWPRQQKSEERQPIVI